MKAWQLVAMACIAAACTPPSTPTESKPRLAAMVEEALMAEARDPLAAEPWLHVLEEAAADPDDPWSLGAGIAAVDALAYRDLPMLGGVDHAVLDRSREALQQATPRLERVWRRGRSPLVRGLAATALHTIALHVGAPKAAARWRRRAGCAPEAAVIGPLAWPPLGALRSPFPVGKGALPEKLHGIAPFAAQLEPEHVYGDSCTIDLAEARPQPGLRAVVVDIDVPRPQRIYVAFSSSAAARVELGGVPLLERPYDAGGKDLVRFGSAAVEAGKARLVALVAFGGESSLVGVQVWDEAGGPVELRAPRAGEIADAAVSDAHAIDVAPDHEPATLAAAATALLAAGDARRAAQWLEAAPHTERPDPALDLLALRARQNADLEPRNQQLDRMQATAERVLEACPGCWEARIQAVAAAQERKGMARGVYTRFERLGVRADSSAWTTELGPMELLFVAIGASDAGLADVARAAYDALAARLPGSFLVADLDWRLHRRLGPDEVAAACQGGTDRSTTRCVQALLARGDVDAAFGEMDRLRWLRGSPAVVRDLELAELVAQGKLAKAVRLYDALPPSQRELALLGALLGHPDLGARERFARDFLGARDAPWAYEPLARLFGYTDDPSFMLERQGAELVARDRAEAFLPGAGVAVLRRIERYELEPSGILRYWLYDLRRVSGTTDVAGGTWMGFPAVEGRHATRFLRRRILKKDGRVIDPDPSAWGAQGDTELSQLQAGDYVEAVLVGWGLPGDGGQLVVDTPDLMPLRTSIREGLVTFKRPKGLDLDLWAHELLGKPQSSEEGGSIVSEWRITDQKPRRIEEGVPYLESRVAFSFGTDSWKRIARGMADRALTMDERDPYVARWVAEAVHDRKAPAEKQVADLLAAVGKKIRRADPSALSDFAGSYGGGSQLETARWILEQGTGSRTWVVQRALRELGIESAIAVAEAQPFTAAPGFPAHTGRFTHPLVRAQIDGKTVWIDADVEGPPLPPGRVSPELRGRQALLASGEMVAVEAGTAADVDDVAVALKLDPSGDATGSFELTLHGQPAQQLADALEVVVGSQRRELLRNAVSGWLPWADVREVKVASQEGSWRITLAADIAVVALARPESRDGRLVVLPGMEAMHVVYPVPSSTTLGARYTSQADRSAALVVDQPLFYRVRRRIDLPPGTKIVHLAQPVDVKAPELQATRKVSQEGNALVEEFGIELPVGTVAPEAFAAFEQAVRTVDDGFAYGTRLELAR